ncbi:ankyrin repeat-containing domain protein [Pyrenochaeta sp. MPI-SDFR-AT-0127]|nr:ankyrin repeat-containing domain protein [Pyrenochaeta sp. MPI-SDFR-AT-0127]
MAPARKETTIDICKRVNAQGNIVAIRMLEYMSSSKEPVRGFFPLATVFIDLARLVWSIEAGINESFKTRKTYPLDITQELDSRFSQVHAEFVVLNQLISKFIENDNGKGGLGKRMRMMFADAEVDKTRLTLLKSCESLKMSSAIFRWTIGDSHADASMSVGYAGLIAALDRVDPKKSTQTAPREHSMLSTPPSPPSKSTYDAPNTLLPPVRLDSRISLNELGPIAGDMVNPIAMRPSNSETNLRQNESGRVPDVRYIQNDLRASSIHSGGSIRGTTQSFTRRSPDGLLHDYSSHEGHEDSSWHQMPIERQRTLLGHQNRYAHDSFMSESKMDSPTIHHRPMHTTGSPRLQDVNGTLLTAVKQGQYHVLEQLLSTGSRIDSAMEAELLSIAIEKNDLQSTTILLQHGVDVNGHDKNGITPLLTATQALSLDCAKILLRNGANANQKDGEGTTALFKAIQARRTDLMTILLDHGADPNLPCPKHPLWPASYHSECLELLLSRGADHKRTPGIMELASSLNKLDSIKVLMRAGVSPNVRKDNAYTPLSSAIRDDSAEIVTYLLENGADPNFKALEYPAWKCITHKRTHFLPQLVAAGADLNTPKGIVELAVSHKDKLALVYLLDQGVNPNDRCVDSGNTALTTAIQENHLEFVDILLKRGASPAVRGQDWPLCMAVKNPTILKRLLVVPGLKPQAFRGVLEMAVHAGQLESVKLLLGAGVSVEDKNCGVFSPLTTAIREGHKDIVRYLLDEANADPNSPGEHLPLVKALRSYRGKDTEIIQMLLSRGADINRMHRGWNAILQSVENSDAQILSLLVSMGGTVDLQAVDENGRPVIEIVKDRDWEEGLALLFPAPTPSPKARTRL